MVTPTRLMILVCFALSVSVSGQQASLTDEEVFAAIRLGQQGKDFSVRVAAIGEQSQRCTGNEQEGGDGSTHRRTKGRTGRGPAW